MFEKRKGLKYVTSLPEDEVFVAMCNHRDLVFIASNKRVYQLVDDRELVPLEILIKKKSNA